MFYSNRLGDIPDSQGQAALTELGLGDLVSTTAIPFGLFGQNFFVTSTQGEFVICAAPHYAWQLPTEQYFAGVITRETTVPTPWPYLVSNSSHPFPWPWGYAAMPRLPGLLLADPEVYAALTAAQRASLAKAEGAMLWSLHRARSPMAGSFHVASGSIRPFAGGYLGRTIDRALQHVSLAFGHGAHSQTDDDWVRGLVDSCRSFGEPSGYSLVHEDFSRNNMTGTIDGDVVTITGLVDLMTSHYGDGLADLARQFSMFLLEPEGESLAQTFVHAYLARSGISGPDVRQRGLLYLLDERLIVWEYAARPGHESLDWWDRSLSLRNWLEPYLDAWASIVDSSPG